PLRARGEPLGGEENASLHELFVVLAHRSERFWRRKNARFGFLRCLANDHETHCSLLNPVRVGCRALHGLTDTSNETGQNRHELRESRKLWSSKSLATCREVKRRGIACTDGMVAASASERC